MKNDATRERLTTGKQLPGTEKSVRRIAKRNRRESLSHNFVIKQVVLVFFCTTYMVKLNTKLSKKKRQKLKLFVNIFDIISKFKSLYNSD